MKYKTTFSSHKVKPLHKQRRMIFIATDRKQKSLSPCQGYYSAKCVNIYLDQSKICSLYNVQHKPPHLLFNR